jgi:hypothetical protein
MTDYRAITRRKSNDEIIFALADISETLALYKDADPFHHPYVRRLYAELDACHDEQARRQRRGHCDRRHRRR